ncbi:MAG: 4-hydroxy-3-methylbut-2-enyl diphosphate reductase [Alphaproteobacteria bacterium]|nr:4-hydroxy-3-methylbut-2-enyl diphosphate reductase [Alphaproteobacteria bacterium]
MKTTRSESIGFCHGVRRALDLAEANSGANVVGGDIVHNRNVSVRLSRDFNINVANNPDDIPEGSIAIIRAHGIAPEIQNKMAARGVIIVDATCPHVKAAQTAVKNFADAGYHIFLLGEQNHPEVQGITGGAPDATVTVFLNTDELANMEIPTHVALASQTTKSIEEFERAREFLAARATDFACACTICPASRRNRTAAAELANECDIMIVIGGRTSSNTRTLFETVAAHCPDSYMIESAAELNPDWFQGKTHCGICAGLSTPDYSIDEVEAAISII